MAYLIWQLLAPLAIAAIGGGVAGWCWHCISTRAAWGARNAERDRLRGELLSFVGASYGDRPAVTAEEHDALMARHNAASNELAAARTALADRERTLTGRDGKIAELEMALSSLRASAPDAEAERARIAALEDALRTAESKAVDVERRAALLEEALDKATAPTEPKDDAAQLRWRIHELEAALAEKPAGSTVSDDEHNRLRWKSRYLNARVAYLEGAVAPPAPAVDPEAENRRRWRQRYLEARVAWLEGRLRDYAALRAQHEQELGARDEHIAALMADADRPRIDPNEHDALRARVDEVEAAYRALHQRATEIDTAYRTLRAQAVEIESANNALRARIGELETAYETLGTRAHELEALNTDLGAKTSDLENAKAALESEIEGLKRRIAELEGLLAASRGETNAAVRRHADLEGANAGLRDHIATLEGRLREPPQDPESGRLRWQARYLDSRVRYLEQSIAAPAQQAAAPFAGSRDGAFAPLAPVGEEVRPSALPAARSGAPDDLRKIVGVSPRIESTLNALGVYHFDQIAAWTPTNVDWIERYLAFKGRISREDWIAQARVLAAGQDPDGGRRELANEPG